ncbi:hypothetical protein PBF_00330 [Cytobacillus firmus DS1]|uniref:Uncharacterized protein n=1 Tax=Cytobacillus firmus DS1 TaxID=1307436 RepID=W7KZN6_CYTFI|nr:hypothetical protein PBF_00330 [Cytobacillus firmus DS1]
MIPNNKHITKSIGLSLLITIFAFFNVDTSYTAIYLLFVSVASFISIYLISLITAKAYQKFLKHTGYN